MKIVFVLWVLGMNPAPTIVAEYATEAECVRVRDDHNNRALSMSTAAVETTKGKFKPPVVGYTCVAQGRP
jgi:hypothetical protein